MKDSVREWGLKDKNPQKYEYITKLKEGWGMGVQTNKPSI